MGADVDASGVINALNRLPQFLTQDLRVAVKEWLTDVQVEAKHTHRFFTKSSALEKSVQLKIEPNVTNSRVYLEDGIAVYGKYIHEGFGDYESGRGWAPDQFLYEAADNKKPQLKPKISRAIAKSIKRAGF